MGNKFTLKSLSLLCIFQDILHYANQMAHVGPIYGSAQSMDPYFAQETMDRAGICGSLYRSIGSLQQPYFYELIFLDRLHY